MTPIDWRHLARTAVGLAGTPCYLMAATLVEDALKELSSIPGALPRRTWLSVKTQPVKPLLHAWRAWGFGVEVVSEYEFVGAQLAGFEGQAILVNGVGKQAWLPKYQVPRVHVHFDSLTEVEALRTQAAALQWTTGIRCQVPNQRDPGQAEAAGQFGMSTAEAVAALDVLRASGISVGGVQFHIGTNLSSADEYRTALAHVRGVCTAARFDPEYVDIGGGLPVPDECPGFDFQRFADVLAEMPHLFPTVRELWMENGRFVTARSGVLVVKVIDRKERPESAYLICDGGRTNHALVADGERHEMLLDPQREGPRRSTTVCGPTCMGSDRLGTWDLPESVQLGDLILWMNAGAYHIPWETRFSFGLAPVVWFDATGRPTVARRRETPEQWWAAWT